MNPTNRDKVARILNALLADIDAGQVEIRHNERVGVLDSGAWRGFKNVWFTAAPSLVRIEFWVTESTSFAVESSRLPFDLADLMRAIWTEVSPAVRVPDEALRFL